MKATRVSKTIPAKRYSNFPNIMNYDKHHGLKKMCLKNPVGSQIVGASPAVPLRRSSIPLKYLQSGSLDVRSSKISGGLYER